MAAFLWLAGRCALFSAFVMLLLLLRAAVMRARLQRGFWTSGYHSGHLNPALNGAAYCGVTLADAWFRYHGCAAEIDVSKGVLPCVPYRL